MSRRGAGLGLVLAAAVLGACGIAAQTVAPTPTRSPSGPAPTITVGVASAREEIAAALGRSNLVLDNAEVPFRPGESPLLAAAPRAVFQVVIPDSSGHGFITVYELGTEEAAIEAGAEQWAYINSGPGRVQFRPDTQFVLRRLNSTVIFYFYGRETSGEEALAAAAALNEVGVPAQ